MWIKWPNIYLFILIKCTTGLLNINEYEAINADDYIVIPTTRVADVSKQNSLATVSTTITTLTTTLSTTINDTIYSSITSNTELDSPIFIFMCIVYVLSTLSAIISNLIVILVYKLGHRTKTDLSIFLVNLAIADFLMSTVCMPFTFAQALLKKWIFGSILCPIVLFKQVLSVSVSIYTLVAIGIDRYIAVKSPLKNRVTHKKGRTVILIVWIISILLAAVQLFVARIERHEYDDLISDSSINTTNTTEYYYSLKNCTNCSLKRTIVTYACNEIWDSEWKRRAYTLFNFFAVYLLPLFILAFTYTCIAWIINSTTHPGNADYSRDMHYNKSKRKVIKMLIILVCVFATCWLPLHMFILIKDFTTWSLPYELWLYYAAHWLAMANCTINPIIYGYSSKNFRSDVYSLIICCNCFHRKSWLRLAKTGNMINSKGRHTVNTDSFKVKHKLNDYQLVSINQCNNNKQSTNVTNLLVNNNQTNANITQQKLLTKRIRYV